MRFFFGPRPHLDKARREYEDRSYSRIEVRPCNATIGAEIAGVDLGELDEPTFSEIEQAFLDYKVVFFRDQPLDTASHLAFARRFGELEEHPFLPPSASNPELVRFEKSEEVIGVENQWHTDVSWRERPALGSLLRAIEVPAYGGDTLFADMVAAYEGLPNELRERVDVLEAIHDFSFSFGRALDPETRKQRQHEFPPVAHPLVRTHPVTGKKALYLCKVFTSHIVGLDPDESRELLERLYDEATVPEYQCRFHWEPDSVALWDNRSVQHYASNDYWPHRRVMERAAIVGDRPV
jgi:taurine dioxygenase